MIRLRHLKEADLEKVMRWRTSEQVTEFMYTSPELNLAKQIDWFKRISSDESKQYWIIVLDGIDIGVINLDFIDRLNSNCFWAYYIAESSVKGKGLARHLECNTYDYVFFCLKLNKLSCEVLGFNERVVNIHEKFGSEVEGVFKQHIYKNGVFHDVIRMAILKDKWFSIRDSFEYESIEIEPYQ